MKIRKLYFVFIMMLFLLSSAGFSKSAGRQNGNEGPLLVLDNLPEFKISRGEVLYSRYCLFCHGESGRGDGLNAFSIPDKPFNLSNQELMDRKSDEELEKVIRHGGASQGLSKYMPSFDNTLSGLQVKYLVDFIRIQLSARDSSK